MLKKGKAHKTKYRLIKWHRILPACVEFGGEGSADLSGEKTKQINNQKNISKIAYPNVSNEHVRYTCCVFADEIVLGFAVVVIPLEHVETSQPRWSGRLMIHHHAHLVAA